MREITDKDREHLIQLFEWSLDELSEACGDGWTTIIIRRFNIKDVKNIIVEYLDEKDISTDKMRWRYGQWKIEDRDDGFTLSYHQEHLIFKQHDNDKTQHEEGFHECAIYLL